MKLNSQTLESHWQEFVGKLHEKWGALDEQELQKARGDLQQLIRIVQQKTGATREAVQEYLDSIAQQYGSTIQQAAETIRSYAGKAAESLQGVREQAADTVESSVKRTRYVVRKHPTGSLLTCFGVGILTGVVAGIAMRSR